MQREQYEIRLIAIHRMPQVSTLLRAKRVKRRRKRKTSATRLFHYKKTTNFSYKLFIYNANLTMGFIYTINR